ALLNMQTALRASMISLGINATYKVGFGKNEQEKDKGCLPIGKFTSHKVRMCLMVLWYL
ncbi:OpsX, partial [Pasteurella multocida subsp. multocida str. Anand1_cattle]